MTDRDDDISWNQNPDATVGTFPSEIRVTSERGTDRSGDYVNLLDAHDDEDGLSRVQYGQLVATYALIGVYRVVLGPVLVDAEPFFEEDTDSDDDQFGNR